MRPPVDTSPLDRLLLELRRAQDALKNRRRPAPNHQNGAGIQSEVAVVQVPVAVQVSPPVELPLPAEVAQVPLPVEVAQVPLPAEVAQKEVPQGPISPYEDLVMARVSSPTVPVGISHDLEVQVTDLWGRPVDFAHISITQVEISARELVNTDSVRLRFYRHGTRRTPQDLVADFDGTSQLTDTWYAAFSDRRIEYGAPDVQSTIYLTARNTTGNSGPTTFQITLYGRRFPPRPPA